MELGYYTKCSKIIHYTDGISGIIQWTPGPHYYSDKIAGISTLKYHSSNSIALQFFYKANTPHSIAFKYAKSRQQVISTTFFNKNFNTYFIWHHL